jgi:hypothetical protein
MNLNHSYANMNGSMYFITCTNRSGFEIVDSQITEFNLYLLFYFILFYLLLLLLLFFFFTLKRLKNDILKLCHVTVENRVYFHQVLATYIEKNCLLISNRRTSISLQK